MDNSVIYEAISNYDFSKEVEEIGVIDDGLINSTFAAKCKDDTKYLVQKINTNVFKNPDELMENIVNVTNYLQDKIKSNGGNPERETLRVIPTTSNKTYCQISDGSYWRCYNFITEAYTRQGITNPTDSYIAGKAFGEFMSLLADYPGETLHETIPDFHNTKKRFENLMNAIESNKSGRKEKALAEIEFALNRKKDTEILVDLIEKNEIPIRVTHNDTKINNVMFDKVTDEALCVIDLDTIMPGLSLYDFGDAIRSGAATAAEDETDLSKMTMDIELFKEYARGYITGAGKSFTENEFKYLAFSAKLLSLECGMRFLTDYLDGDVYFRTEYDEHNIVRCRTQFKLVEDIESKMDEMNKIVDECRKMVLN